MHLCVCVCAWQFYLKTSAIILASPLLSETSGIRYGNVSCFIHPSICFGFFSILAFLSRGQPEYIHPIWSRKKKKPNKLLFSSNAVKPATSFSDWAWTVKLLSLGSDGLHDSSKILLHLEDTSAPLQDSNDTSSPPFFCEGVQSSIRSQHTSVKTKSNQLSNELLLCEQLLTSLKAISSV